MFSNLSSEECHIIKEEEEEESSEETSTTERIEHTGDKMQVHKLESNNINILKFCPLFNLLSKEFVSKLYMVQICGETLDGILLMTTDLMMYGLGNNRGGQLGIGHMSVTLQPVLIGILSGKKIKKLIYLNTPAVFALTEEGQVYSWGNNDCNILGLAINSFDKQTYSKFVLVPSLITSLRKERIVDIAACEYHAVGLAESGKVYMWGKLCYYEHQTENYSKFGTLDYNYQTENYSNFGTLDYINVEVPLVVWPDTSKQIKYICCGNEFTIAVTEEGVYGVGKNSEYQLGVNGASFLVDTSLRFKLIFPNDKIIKVACGSSHVMALDDEGHLYVWGSNEYGQLGKDKSTAKSLRKMLNEPEMGKIINIAALSHKNISVALNDKGRVYVWGFYLSQVLDAPMEINVSDMYKVFGCNLPYIICASPLKHSDNFEDTDKMSEIFQNIETMFDDYVRISFFVLYLYSLAVAKTIDMYCKTH
ncbi:RCC1 and BTB domain-containing protein 2-like [Pseudomyrmex gracilis]|uniref:RCC1 and BTB domain-containing protein 2-like n=1 Tax=Pseudomyrmex gracilis TaxID=219809 RepID=UPI000994C163|nr:RCC1 and BTB domain-containing protein 2-like [Pseudomyrmex gracilis]